MDSEGKPITLVDIYEKALEGYEMSRIEQACDNIIEQRVSPFFPVPAEIKKYYYDLPQPTYKELPEPEIERTPDEERRFFLIRQYTMRPFLTDDDGEADNLRAEIKDGGPEGLEKYIQEHWDD